MRWINDLPTTSLLTVDHTIFGAEDLRTCAETLPPGAETTFRPDVRNVVHLHGFNAPAAYDGTPDQWYTPGLTQIGPLFKTDVFEYPNRQPAAQLHYHDHAIGVTRQNVYSGLQGYYFICDPVEENLPLPKIPFEIPFDHGPAVQLRWGLSSTRRSGNRSFWLTRSQSTGSFGHIWRSSPGGTGSVS